MRDATPEKDNPFPVNGSRLIRLAQKRAVKSGKAFDVTIELTHRCNVSCRHCYILPGEEELPLAAWEDILSQVADHGVFVLSLTGGEPTMYPHFLDFVELTSRLNFAVRVFSNLTAVSDEAIDRLCAAHVLGIETTIHAADAETHDRFCRSPGAFEKTIAALHRMKEKGLPVTIKTTWTRYNHKDPGAMFRLAEDLSVYLRASPSVTPRRDMSTDHFDCRLNEEELFDLFMTITRLSGDPRRLASCDAYPLPEDDVHFCGAGITGVRIGPSGKVYPCVEMLNVVGDLKEQSFDDIWRNSPFLKELRGLRLRDAEGCVNCPDLRFCFRCPGQAVNEGAGLCGPSREACMLARVNRRTYEALKREMALETTGRSDQP